MEVRQDQQEPRDPNQAGLGGAEVDLATPFVLPWATLGLDLQHNGAVIYPSPCGHNNPYGENPSATLPCVTGSDQVNVKDT